MICWSSLPSHFVSTLRNKGKQKRKTFELKSPSFMFDFLSVICPLLHLHWFVRQAFHQQKIERVRNCAAHFRPPNGARIDMPHAAIINRTTKSQHRKHRVAQPFWVARHSLELDITTFNTCHSLGLDVTTLNSSAWFAYRHEFIPFSFRPFWTIELHFVKMITLVVSLILYG